MASLATLNSMSAPASSSLCLPPSLCSAESRYLFVTHRVQVACVTPPCTPTHSQVFIAGLREELEASLSQPSQDPQLPKDCSFKGQLAVYLTSTLRLGIIFLISFFLWHKFLGKLFIIIVD